MEPFLSSTQGQVNSSSRSFTRLCGLDRNVWDRCRSVLLCPRSFLEISLPQTFKRCLLTSNLCLCSWPNGRQPKKLLPWSARCQWRSSRSRSSLPGRACWTLWRWEIKIRRCGSLKLVKAELLFTVLLWLLLLRRFTCSTSPILWSKGQSCSCPSRPVWRWRSLEISSWRQQSLRWFSLTFMMTGSRPSPHTQWVWL